MSALGDILADYAVLIAALIVGGLLLAGWVARRGGYSLADLAREHARWVVPVAVFIALAFGVAIVLYEPDGNGGTTKLLGDGSLDGTAPGHDLRDDLAALAKKELEAGRGVTIAIFRDGGRTAVNDELVAIAAAEGPGKLEEGLAEVDAALERLGSASPLGTSRGTDLLGAVVNAAADPAVSRVIVVSNLAANAPGVQVRSSVAEWRGVRPAEVAAELLRAQGFESSRPLEGVAVELINTAAIRRGDGTCRAVPASVAARMEETAVIALSTLGAAVPEPRRESAPPSCRGAR